MFVTSTSANDLPSPAASVSRLATLFNALIIAGVLALVGASALTIETLCIGGPMYGKIISSRELVADLQPPPLTLIEAWQEVADLYRTPQDAVIRAQRLAALHHRYDQRAVFWAHSTLTGAAGGALLTEADGEAQKFWREVETVYIPAIREGLHEAADASFETLVSTYDAHRAIVDRLIETANARSLELERTAAEQNSRFLMFVTVVTAMSLAAALLAIRLVRARLIEPLTELARYMSEDPSRRAERAPFVERDDEIGVIARATASFRSSVEERIVESAGAQLDAALNNIVQGLEMYDAEGRLVLCNRRLAELYRLSLAQMPTGLSLQESINLRVGTRTLSQDAADRLRERVERGVATPDHREFLCHLTDGRWIAIAIQPISGGEGFVATHQDVTEQRNAEARVAYFAHHDSLTGLPNRARLGEELEKALAHAKRGEQIAVHALDLDSFKAVNDTLGHQTGDTLLERVADRLMEELGESDTVARVGGDEFTVIERKLADPHDAASLATRMIEALSQPFEIDGHRIIIGASVGIAIAPRDGSTADELVRSADLALYRAKADGRGTFCFFEPEMNAEMQARHELERELRRALENGEFEVFYQPIVNIETNQLSGFEALVRWRHPEKGLVPPIVFIPLAEETRLIVPLGDWVLREACKRAAAWPDELKVAVNLSATQFQLGKIGDVVAAALAESGLAPQRLELEITETVLLDGTEGALATLHALRGLGVRIVMDDFGTGYSSLSYLQSFPFDKIKIDKSFVQGIDDNEKSLNIVRAVATLANGLGIRTTAEGVESLSQLEAVRSEGCSEIQGFLMSKPLPLPEVEMLLSMRRGMFADRVQKAEASEKAA